MKSDERIRRVRRAMSTVEDAFYPSITVSGLLEWRLRVTGNPERAAFSLSRLDRLPKLIRAPRNHHPSLGSDRETTPAFSSRAFSLTMFLLLGLLYSAWIIDHTTVAANNDTFLQLLAADGLMSGEGYGFHENGTFIALAARNADTRWPLGISLLATIFRWLKLNPLVSIINMMPLLAFGTYSLMTFALATDIDLRIASVFAFAALTPLSVLQAFTSLNSEPFALFFGAALFVVVLSRSDGSRRSLLRQGCFLVFLSWMLTSFRNAGAFLVIAACLTFVLFRASRVWVALRLTVLLLAGALLPLFLFHWLCDLAVSHSSRGMILSGSGVLRLGFQQLTGNIALLAEVVVPRMDRLLRHRWLVYGLGWIVFVFLAVAVGVAFRRGRWRTIGGLHWNVGTGARPALVSFTIVVAYAVLLAGSAVRYNYDWADVYRVSGFAVPWGVVAFSTGLLLLGGGRRYMSIAAVVFTVALAAGRLAQASRRQAGLVGTDVAHCDYRVLVSRVTELAVSRFSHVDRLAVYTSGHWSGRYLQRSLWYSKWWEGKAPWAIEDTASLDLKAAWPARTVVLVSREDEAEAVQNLGIGRALEEGRVAAVEDRLFLLVGFRR